MESSAERIRSWIVLTACTFLQFTTDGSLKSIGLFYVAILDEFHTSVSSTSLISGVMLGIFCLSSLPIMTYLIDAITPRGVLVLGSVLLSAGYSVSCLSPNFYFLFFSLSVLTGTSMACIFPPSIYVLGSHFSSKRATYTGIAVSSGSLGVLLCPPLYQYLITSYGLRGAFLLTGGILLHNVPMACLMSMPKHVMPSKRQCLDQKANTSSAAGSRLNSYKDHSLFASLFDKKYSNSAHLCGSDPLLKKEGSNNAETNTLKDDLRFVSERCLYSKHQQEKHILNIEYLSRSTHVIGYSMNDFSKPSNSTTSDDFDKDVETESKCLEIISMLKNPSFIVFLFTLSLANITPFTFVPFLPIYAKEIYLDDTNMVILLSLTGAMDLIGRLMCGILADRSFLSCYQILALSQIVCGVTLFFNQLFNSFTGLVIACVLIGLFGNTHLILKHSLMVDICGTERYPLALAITTVSQLPLFVIGPYVFGFLRETSGSFSASYYLIGVLAVLSGFMFMYVPLVRRCRNCRT